MKKNAILEFIKKRNVNKRDPFPRNIHFSMTNRCNLFCSFCGQNRKKWSQENELCFDDYTKVLDQVARMKKRTVSFSGGEIFLHPAIDQVFEYCSNKKIPVSMVLTNGTLLNEERIMTLLAAKPAHIGFSIDGTEAVHDQVRGVKGSYEKTVAAIRSVARAGSETGQASPSIGVNYVMAAETIDSMEEVVEELCGLGLSSIRFQYLVYITPDKLEQHKSFMKKVFPDYLDCYWDKFVAEPGCCDAKKLTEMIKGVQEKGRSKKIHIDFSFDFNDSEIDLWYNSDIPILNNCAFLDTFLVLPNGDVPFCDFIRHPVGNVRDLPLETLWADPKGRQFREMTREKLLPGCERCCQLM